MDKSNGSIEQFRENWQRPEAKYCHFTRGEPVNQIQFAFRQNWSEFAKIMEPLRPWAGKRSLEVGAGRGTMSMYFADNGFECTLLDKEVRPLQTAQRHFGNADLPVDLVHANALSIPADDCSYDTVFNYGLFEHYENITPFVQEQVRVLKPGGVLIAYVVPHEPNQGWIMAEVLSILMSGGKCDKEQEPRFAHYTEECWQVFLDSGLTSIGCNWVYPLPMIGPSNNFPFTLNSDPIEKALVKLFSRYAGRWSSWVEWECQAFIVWGWKR